MNATRLAIAALVAPMTLAALAFWAMAFMQGGTEPVIGRLGFSATALFTMAHLPTMAGAILLWRWQVARAYPLIRWALFVSMIYFSAACIIAFFGNFLAASILGRLM